MTRQRLWRMASLFAVLLSSAWCDPSPALAQEQDVIGIYFDDQGISTTKHTSGDWEWVDAWLVIKGMSAASFRGFGACGRIEGRFDYYCWNSLIGYQDIWCQPIWWLSSDPPRPATEILATVKMWLRVPSPADVIRFYVQPSKIPLPEFEDIAFYEVNDPPPGGGTGTIIALTPSSGSYDIPVAVVNGVVSTEGSSWGAVKALYRE